MLVPMGADPSGSQTIQQGWIEMRSNQKAASVCTDAADVNTVTLVANENRFHNGAPSWIRTSDLRLRSPLLYPAELSGQMS